jgi:hypothetical protein
MRAVWPTAATAKQWSSAGLCHTNGGAFQAQQMPLQFLQAGPALQVELEHFPGPFGRLAAGPHDNQQAGDQGHVDLDGNTVGVGSQQVPTTEDAFEPAKKEFRLPAIMPPKRRLYQAFQVLCTCEGLISTVLFLISDFWRGKLCGNGQVSSVAVKSAQFGQAFSFGGVGPDGPMTSRYRQFASPDPAYFAPAM